MSEIPKTGPSKRPANFRRIVFINPKFQVSMIVYGVLLVVWVTAVFYFYESLFLFKLHEALGGDTAPQADAIGTIERIHTMMAPWFILSTTAIALTIISLLTFLSHRIAGPIYHAEQYLKIIAKDPSRKRRIKFREKDYFHELADSINLAIPAEVKENGNKDQLTAV